MKVGQLGSFERRLPRRVTLPLSHTVLENEEVFSSCLQVSEGDIAELD